MNGGWKARMPCPEPFGNRARISPSGNWGDRYSWHKQELWKGRKSFVAFLGPSDWSGKAGMAPASVCFFGWMNMQDNELSLENTPVPFVDGKSIP